MQPHAKLQFGMFERNSESSGTKHERSEEEQEAPVQVCFHLILLEVETKMKARTMEKQRGMNLKLSARKENWEEEI